MLLTSAEFETEKALQDQLEKLQEQYAGDLIIEVWGQEKLTAELRDCGALVNQVRRWVGLYGRSHPGADGLRVGRRVPDRRLHPGGC